VRIFSKRDLIRVTSQARAGISTRFRIRIENHPDNPAVAAAPYTSGSAAPDPVTDKLVYGAGVFSDKKDEIENEETGSARARRARLYCHVQYEVAFRKGYAVDIGSQKGSWDIVGVARDMTGSAITVYLLARA